MSMTTRAIASLLNIPHRDRKRLKDRQSEVLDAGVNRLFRSVPYAGEFSEMLVVTMHCPKFSKKDIDLSMQVRESTGGRFMNSRFTNPDAEDAAMDAVVLQVPPRRPAQTESLLAFLDRKLQAGTSTTLANALQEYVNEETKRARKRVRLCSEHEELIQKAEEIAKAEAADAFEQSREAFLQAEECVWTQETEGP
ncbi:putative mitochondrial protein [Andalucia godoyi]|uniref:Putative mitochondrial protein n=1 Tax=Andalucia godoyi TaxID=505711 RepID=A0A8K0AH08_ANDGO|nr:putative mitochondrial protein [Andalucia godoyi]|eukprot:ANDGO_07397.mRNA.1 putative mitochondrial protein